MAPQSYFASRRRAAACWTVTCAVNIITTGVTSPDFLFPLESCPCSVMVALYMQVAYGKACRLQVSQELCTTVLKHLTPVWMFSSYGEVLAMQR